MPSSASADAKRGPPWSTPPLPSSASADAQLCDNDRVVGVTAVTTTTGRSVGAGRRRPRVQKRAGIGHGDVGEGLGPSRQHAPQIRPQGGFVVRVDPELTDPPPEPSRHGLMHPWKSDLLDRPGDAALCPTRPQGVPLIDGGLGSGRPMFARRRGAQRVHERRRTPS